jgi:hypothetical protein
VILRRLPGKDSMSAAMMRDLITIVIRSSVSFAPRVLRVASVRTISRGDSSAR